MTNTFGLNGLPLQQALEPWVASLPSMCWIVESTLGNYHFGRLSIAMIHVGCILFKAIPLCAPCTRKWLNILLWWQTFVRTITFNGRAMLTFRHHHFRKTFLSFVPHFPNKPKKEVQTTLFRVQKRFSIIRSWLPKCSICTPSKNHNRDTSCFFLSKDT